MIAEFGWPSAGYNMHRANPGRIEQASVLRDFISRAEAYGIDYNIIEAFDQPWKTNEGSVGMYWGVFDAAAPSQVHLGGAGEAIPTIGRSPSLAVLLGLLLSLPILARSRATLGEAFILALAANVARRLVRHGLCLLADPLFRARRRLRARPRDRRCSSRWSRSRSHALKRSPPSPSGAAPVG